MLRITIITCLLSSFFNKTVISQEWFSNDNVWVYTYEDGLSGTLGYAEMKVIGDTILDNQNANILEVNIKAINRSIGDSVINSFTEISYQSGDTIFTLNKENEFEMNYNLGIEVGDSLVYFNNEMNCAQTITYHLDSISQLALGNESLKVQHFTVIDDYWNTTIQRTVVEKIGCLENRFNLHQYHTCLFDGPSFIMCSFGNNFELIDFKNGDCYFLPLSTEFSSSINFKIYPNPVKYILNIESSENLDKAELYDMQGQLIGRYKNFNQIDISNLSKGIYLMKVSVGQKFNLKKIVIE